MERVWCQKSKQHPVKRCSSRWILHMPWEALEGTLPYSTPWGSVSVHHLQWRALPNSHDLTIRVKCNSPIQRGPNPGSSEQVNWEVNWEDLQGKWEEIHLNTPQSGCKAPTGFVPLVCRKEWLADTYRHRRFTSPAPILYHLLKRLYSEPLENTATWYKVVHIRCMGFCNLGSLPHTCCSGSKALHLSQGPPWLKRRQQHSSRNMSNAPLMNL